MPGFSLANTINMFISASYSRIRDVLFEGQNLKIPLNNQIDKLTWFNFAEIVSPEKNGISG